MDRAEKLKQFLNKGTSKGKKDDDEASDDDKKDNEDDKKLKGALSGTI